MKLEIEIDDDAVAGLKLESTEDIANWLNSALALFRWATEERASGSSIVAINAKRERLTEASLPILDQVGEIGQGLYLTEDIRREFEAAQELGRIEKEARTGQTEVRPPQSAPSPTGRRGDTPMQDRRSR